MKKLKVHLVLALAWIAGIGHVAAQGTAFTYQGKLQSGGLQANGTYDLNLSVFDAPAAGTLIAGPAILSGVPVTNGLFTVTVDFGGGVFTGAARWLDIGVRTNGAGTFTAVVPRQPFSATPYSIYSGTAAAVGTGSAVTSLNGLKDGVTLSAGTNITITPNGNTLTFNAAGAGGSGIWGLNGSNTYYNLGNVGIGTASPQENLTIAGVTSYNNGLKLTGSTAGGAGLSLEGTAAGGHKYALFSGGSSESVGPGGFGLYDDTAGSYRLAITAGGKVGIGTAIPHAGLEVQGEWDGANGALTLGAELPTLRFSGGSQAGFNSWAIQNSADGPGNLEVLNKPLAIGASFSPVFTITPSGSVGIGTVNPAESLTIAGVSSYNTGLKLTGSTTAGTGLALENTSAGGHKYDLISGGSADGIGAGAFGIYDESAASYRLSISPSGTVVVKVLTITGGADIAEPFKMTDDAIPKGAVVVIDEARPGQLKLSSSAYDNHVAGIVSGANGINPGLALHQSGVNDRGQNVALTGRVYAQADAAYGAIHPGDLLTTSDTPGYAMRVGDHTRAQGAILGKAMTGLPQGKGFVLVLVSLQ